MVIDMGLECFCEVVCWFGLGRLVKCVVIVIGINGKGFICVLFVELLCEQGLLVGVYSLLYLLCYNEWVWIDGIEVGDV